MAQQILEMLSSLHRLFTYPGSSVYWLYLASTLCLASAIYCVMNYRNLSLSALIQYVLPRHIYTGRGFVHDVCMMLINTLLYSYFIISYVISSTYVTEKVWHGLYNTFGEVESPLQGYGAVAGVSISGLLAVDVAFFLSHWLHHRIPVLWEFHKVHHSAETLNPFTVFRRHPFEYYIEGNIAGIFSGVAFGSLAWLSGDVIDMATIMGVNTGLFCFMLLGAHLQHSHIWLSYGPIFNRIFVSPAMHQIHHSKAKEHMDKNMGNIFSFWDWIMGTLYIPEKKEHLEIGLVRDEERIYKSLPSMYFLPLLKAFNTILLLFFTKAESRKFYTKDKPSVSFEREQ